MKLITAIRANPLFNGLLQRFNHLTPVQQFCFYALGLWLLAALIFLKVIAPLNTSRTAAQQRLPQLEREYVLMQSQAAEIESLRKLGTTTAVAASPVTPKQAFAAAALSAQFGATAAVTKVRESVFTLSQSGTTVAQFIDNTAALQSATGATLGDFTLKRDATSGLISVSAQFLANSK